MVAESWLNERVSNDQRGQMFSIYAITCMASMAAGQYLLVVAEPSRDTLFMLGAILFALALIPTSVSRAQSPAPLNKSELDIKGLFLSSPAAAVGAFVAGVISATWTTFGPVYGQQVGMSSAMIASLLAAALAGSAIFQFPLGKLSDLIDRRYVMVLAGIIGIIAGSVMTALSAKGEFGTLFFVAVFLYGGVIFSIYSLAVALANDRAGDDFVKVASSVLLIYGIGTMVGPLVAAQIMSVVGPAGVFTTTTIFHALFGGYALYRTFRRERVGEEDREEYQGVRFGQSATPESYYLDPLVQSDPYQLEAEDELPSMPPPVKVERL